MREGGRRREPKLPRTLARCGILALVLAAAFPAAVWGFHGGTASPPSGPFVLSGTTGPPLTKLCTAGTVAAPGTLPGASNGGPGGMQAPSIGFLGLTHNTAQFDFGGDISGGAGSDNYVQTINTSIGIFSRSGKLLCSAVDTGALWGGAGGPCQVNGFSDAVVLFDQKAGRWFITRFTADNAKPHPNWFQCVAVSKTSDPTGGYFRYTFPISMKDFPYANDYPKFGIWRDAYYMTANARTCCPGNPPGLGNNVGMFVTAFERSAMVKGPERT